ncbi:protein FAM47E [Cuculus canorus]|uniref:protein FAM47E n=1 Tax=Cuculus canorus TaxID=55661 RepID=UPI0023AA9013|nr:protein FAM47E [Cuculus canorus]XP_053922247.1 protein FAM47E [Cuculus canorus]
MQNKIVFPTWDPLFQSCKNIRRVEMSCKDFQESRLRLLDSLNGQRWIFLKKGLDDFRNGFPPSCDNMIVYGRKQPASVTLQNSTLKSLPAASTKERNKCGKVQVCLSKLSPLQQARREYVAQIERCLNERSRRFCPCLGKNISPKGEGNCNVDEDTPKGLLNTSCERGATVPLPSYAVKYNNVETEQLKSQEISLPPLAVGSYHLGSLPCQDKVPSQTKRGKIKYGAWYLDPEMWRKRKANGPLKVPEAAVSSFGNAQNWSEKEMKIAQLHITQAFKEFLERKGYRDPQFLPKMPAGGNDCRVPEETPRACREVSKEIGQNKRRFRHAHELRQISKLH